MYRGDKSLDTNQEVSLISSDPPYYFIIKVGMQSDENAGQPQGFLSPECSSGGKERKLLPFFWLGLIQVVF